MLYVPLNSSPTADSVEALNLRNCSSTLIHLPRGSTPSGAAYDAANGMVYVSDFSLNQVYILNGTKIAATLSGSWFHGPSAILYVPMYRDVVVANYQADNLTVIHDQKVLGVERSLGSGPASLAFNAAAMEVLIWNRISHSITVIVNASSPAQYSAKSLSLPNSTYQPMGVAYDPANRLDIIPISILAASSGRTRMNSSLAEFSASNGSVVYLTNLTGFHFDGSLGFSPHSKAIFVSGFHGFDIVRDGVVIGRGSIGARYYPSAYFYDSQLRSEMLEATGSPGALFSVN